MRAARPRRLDSGACALAAVVSAIVLASCYKPHILEGGFICSASNACPDGFTCAADHHCYTVPPIVPPPKTDGGTDTAVDVAPPKTDGGMGGEAGTCTAPTPLCADGPDAGEACSPACQRGCACGRCNVVDGKATCVAAGSAKLGDVCNPNADNCAAGLICLLEPCGNGLARCYQHCTADDQCNGTKCSITIQDSAGNNTAYSTCDVPPQTCNALDGSGCPNLALNCYLTSANQTLCDCPSSPTKQGMNNDLCNFYSDCAASFICIGLNNQPPRCHFVCDVDQPSCPANGDGGMQACLPTGTGSKYGYCSN